MRYEPIVLHRGDPVSWVLMPKLAVRILKFMELYNHDTTGPLPQVVYTAFGGGDQRVFVCVVIDNEESEIVGHMVASIESYLGEATGFIHQWEIDKGLPAEDLSYLRAAIDAMMVTWCAGIGLKSMTAMALDEPRAKLFKKHRFDRFAVLVKRRM